MKKLHIGIIPDGNRKGAKQQQISLRKSYEKGAQVALEVVHFLQQKKQVSDLVFYALSNDNLKLRTKQEINGILAGINFFLAKASKLEGISLVYHGMIDEPRVLKVLLPYLRPTRREKSKLKVHLLVNYSPDWDLGQRPILTQSIPKLDFIIRTDGATRLSGFLPYQSTFAQLYYPSVVWSEFSTEHLSRILRTYADFSGKRKSGA